MMAGHSKWKNTKRRKAVQDIRRGKIFSKLIREVKTAAKLGGKDIAYNSRLRVILEKASSNNMKKNTFNRAIFNQLNERNNRKIVMEEIIYEGYGPGGTALLLKCLTNNKNRSVSEVRYVLSKFGGNLGTSGSVAYLFDKRGVVSFISELSEDIMMNVALKIGADDITMHEDGVVKIYISSDLLSDLEVKLKSFNLKICESKIFMVPYSYIDLCLDDSLKLFKLIAVLKDIHGIYEIYHNGQCLEH